MDRTKKPIRTRVNVILFGLGASLLVACALPERAPSAAVFDFGLTPLTSPVLGQTIPAGKTLNPSLALSVQSVSALEGTGMLYRLAYAQTEHLRSYSLARWAMPPAELFQMRLRETLGPHFLLFNEGERSARVLCIQILEFSQVFETQERSHAVVRFQASLTQTFATDRSVSFQRDFLIKKDAERPNAESGVLALREAADAAASEVLLWLLKPH